MHHHGGQVTYSAIDLALTSPRHSSHLKYKQTHFLATIFQYILNSKSLQDKPIFIPSPGGTSAKRTGPPSKIILTKNFRPIHNQTLTLFLTLYSHQHTNTSLIHNTARGGAPPRGGTQNVRKRWPFGNAPYANSRDVSVNSMKTKSGGLAFWQHKPSLKPKRNLGKNFHPNLIDLLLFQKFGH